MRIRIALPFESVFYAPYYVAIHRGMFAHAGLDAETYCFGDGAKAAAELARGAIDVAVGGIMRSLMLYDQGDPAPPVHFARINDRDGFFLVGRPGDFSWPDLLGRRLMRFAEAPTPWYILRAHLRGLALDPDRITVVPDRPLPEVAAAFRAGETDYLETPAPVAEELLRDGAAVIHREMAIEIGPLPYSSYSVTPDRATKEPGLLEAVARANVDALAWIQSVSGSDVWDAIRPAFTGEDATLMRRAVERYHRLGLWHSDATLPRASFDTLATMLQRGDLIRRIAPYEVCCNDQPTRTAMATGT
jgi:NitT/TauT family transport system substrate-binding protein